MADAGYAENNHLNAGSSVKLSTQYDAHSCRNAVASLLAAEHVPTVDIAGHMLCSADNLTSTYISPIVDPSDYPAACLARIPRSRLGHAGGWAWEESAALAPSDSSMVVKSGAAMATVLSGTMRGRQLLRGGDSSLDLLQVRV